MIITLYLPINLMHNAVKTALYKKTNKAMNYIEVRFEIESDMAAELPQEMYSEILVAMLGELQYESFTETEKGFNAYIQEAFFSEEALKEIDLSHIMQHSFTYATEVLAQKNWNAEWEKNFPMIEVDGCCCVRAPFHEKPDGVVYDIVIEPKMSFGTGHHETTFMMMQHILDMDVAEQTVLDMGCGTGVLAILTAMKAAHPITAIDIDEWSYENTIENIERNDCKDITVKLGDASLIPTEATFDLVLANINRNILLNDMAVYVISMKPAAQILFSGFFESDIPMLTEKANSLGLSFIGKLTKNRWASLRFELKS